MNIKEVAQKKLGGYKFEGEKLTIHTCPFCNDNNYKFIYREMSNTYVCKSCTEYGSAEDLAKKVGVDCIDSQVIPSVKFNIDDVRNKIEIVETLDGVLSFYDNIKIDYDTLEKANVFTTKGFENMLSFVSTDEKNNIKAIKVVKYVNNKLELEIKSDCLNYLWGLQQAKGDNLIITSSDSARLALIQHGIENVVSTINSQNINWIEECFDFLESKTKILLLFDKDYSDKFGEEIIYRLGKFKTSKIEHGYNKIIDIHLNNDTELLDEIRGYKYDIKIENLISFNAINIEENAKPIDLGDKIMNAMLAGGYEGELTIYSGLPASGKSTILNQMICNLADKGDGSMIYSGEFKTTTLKQKLQEVAAGKKYLTVTPNKFDPKLNERKLISKEIGLAIDEHFQDKIQIYDYNIMAKANDLIKTIEIAYKKKGTKVFVLDNLMTIWLDGNENEKLQKQTDLVVQLKALTKNYPIHIFLVAHPKKIENPKNITMHDIAGTSNIANLADNIIFVRRLEDKEILDLVEKNKNKNFNSVPSIELKLLKDRRFGRSEYKNYMTYDKDTGRLHSVMDTPYWTYKWEEKYAKKKSQIAS